MDSLDLHEDSFPGLGSEHLERSRADKFKRSSLKKVDSLKRPSHEATRKDQSDRASRTA